MSAGSLGRVAVMGAGAVGCFYGSMLARAGEAVTLIGRPRHVEAVNRHGLVLEMGGGKEHVAMGASTDPSAVAGARLVLFCVKSTATDEAARAIAPHLAPDALVLALQNGVDNAERIRAAVNRPVVPAVVYVGCAMAGPGHRPTRPQPMPNRAAPPIRRASIGNVAGVWNCSAMIGVERRRTTSQAIAIGRIAPAMTKARVGSQAPATSRNARTRAGSIMPETARPAPNSVPLTSERMPWRITASPPPGA